MAIEFRGRDGREFSLLVSAARFGMEGREYLVLNGRDVTRSERERLEREAILENASIGIALGLVHVLCRELHDGPHSHRLEQMF